MKAMVMDGSTIKSEGMLGAGAMLTPGKIVASGELWTGSPAKFWRHLTPDDIAQFDLRSGQYERLAQDYVKEYKNG